jgi:hypothetical protein
LKVEFSKHLALGEFAKHALRDKFLRLIRGVELQPHNSEEYILEFNGMVYVLAPNLVFDEWLGAAR